MKAIRHARGLNKGLFGFILLALLLALALPIGNAGVAQAQPGAVTITDSFEDETRIAFKENVAVDTIAGQVELYPVLSATYGGSEKDYFYSVYADGNYIYAAGNTDSEGEGEQDALLVKFNISLPSGTYTGCGFTFQDSGLTLADSNRTLADSTLTLAACSISGPQPPVGVDGEAYPVNKLAILIPWIGLIAALLAGATIVILRFRLLRRRSSSQ